MPAGRLDESALHRRAIEALHGAAEESPVPGKWSDRKTLLFILAVCGGFWAAVIGAAVALAR
jgi:hypothetical protein